MKGIGFSGHAPVPFENNYAIKDSSSLRDYVDDINGLKEKYRGQIEIHLGLEADHIPRVSLDFRHFVNNFKLDYIIGSVHLVKSNDGMLWFIDGPDREIWIRGLEIFFGNDIQKAVDVYYRQIMDMAITQKPDIIGHVDKIKMHNRGEYFSEDEKWYRNLVTETLEVIKENNCIVEINTRGIYKKRSDSLFPGEKTLLEIHDMKIPVTISSDAHKPDEVNLGIAKTAKLLSEIGFKEACVYDSGWKSVKLS